MSIDLREGLLDNPHWRGADRFCTRARCNTVVEDGDRHFIDLATEGPHKRVLCAGCGPCVRFERKHARENPGARNEKEILGWRS